MAEFSSTGLVIATQAEIEADLVTTQRAEIDAELDTSTSSPIGQINDLVARKIRTLEEALAGLANALDPEVATGDALIRLCALTGTYREPATATRVEAVADLDAGTYAAGSLAAYPDGRAEDRFVNGGGGARAGGGATGVGEAETSGALEVLADTLVHVASVGFNGITSNLEGEPGQDIETEAALRARRAAEVAAPGSSSLPGIAADLTREIPAIEYLTVTHNTTETTVDTIPPHAVEAVVYGPASPTTDDDAAVAAVLFASVAGGIATHGTTTVNHVDTEGVTHVIKFTRPAFVDLSPTITLVRAATGYAGDAAVAAAIAAIPFRPGLDASWSAVVAAAQGVAGVLRVATVNLGGGAFVNTSINARQIARIDSGAVTVTSSIGAP